MRLTFFTLCDRRICDDHTAWTGHILAVDRLGKISVHLHAYNIFMHDMITEASKGTSIISGGPEGWGRGRGTGTGGYRGQGVYGRWEKSSL